MKKKLLLFFTVFVLVLSGCSLKSTDQSTAQDSSDINGETVTSIDVSEFIGQPISVAVEMFGEYNDSYDSIGQPICKFSDGLVMTKGNNLISSVIIDYSEISSKTKYSYKGINGNSTKSDVIEILGEPEKLRFTSDSYSRYPINNNEFSVTYSEDGLVVRFKFEVDR
ncbi:MAG: hypothetical protein ACLTL7_15675 [Enterocloster bolteae]|uniref:hypothetical protein n=1 Tax=Enterocloster bolteae TaxID=208479 RepID=UPI003991AB0E